jgi:hypothetical protein
VVTGLRIRDISPARFVDLTVPADRRGTDDLFSGNRGRTASILPDDPATTRVDGSSNGAEQAR